MKRTVAGPSDPFSAWSSSRLLALTLPLAGRRPRQSNSRGSLLLRAVVAWDHGQVTGDPFAQMLQRLKEMTDPQRRGFEFQEWVRALFVREHFKVEVDAQGGRPRQVDLMASRHDVNYLVETKWWTKPVGIDALDSLFARLQDQPSGVIGILMSWSGFTASVPPRVVSKRARPVLLVSGAELEGDIRLSDLLHWKKQRLLIDGEAVVNEDQRPRRRRPSGVLPSATEGFVDLTGDRSKWIVGEGGFGRTAFVRELQDIDWVSGAGHGVVLNLRLPVHHEDGLVAIVNELNNLGWVTGSGRWSFQQATRNWHGIGPETFVEALKGWRSRFRALPGGDLHHTEEFCFVDGAEEGFYTLSGGVSADPRRMVWNLAISLQMSGIPVRQEAIRHLCDTLRVPDPIYYRPLERMSVQRTHLEERPVLDVVGFVIDDTLSDLDPDEVWAVGAVARNPFRGLRTNDTEWPWALRDTELLVCSLRNWHVVGSPKAVFRLWGAEWSWSSDGLVFQPIADWDDENDTRPHPVLEFPP